MSLNNFAPDQVLLDQISALDSLDPQVQQQVMSLGIQLLEGKDITEEVRRLAQEHSVGANKLGKICPAVATLLWDCSKFAPKNQLQNTLQDLLLHTGLSETVVASFCKTFQDNKRRLLALKGALGVCAYSYQNLSWRLEVELAKRNMHVMSEPKYLVRLDLVNNAIAAEEASTSTSSTANKSAATAGSSNSKYQSFHLQADHAALKLLEQELQRAVDEVNSVHCQRINRYLS